jgi:prepilin-type processing-associated H-X9-DG protein
MTRPLRHGFSLFQLLMVLALLLILFALLLPAVARARVTAARMRSANNLRQLALACLNYESTYGHYPPGNDDNNFSTATYCLPYIEQNNVFQLIDMKKAVDDQANAAARKLVIKTFLNPQDGVESVTPDFGATNYLFSAGSKPALEENDGVFYQGSKTKISDILDGTSNTLVAGETLKGDGGVKAMDVKRQHVLLKKEDLKDLKDDAGVQDFKDNKNIAGDRCASWMDGRFLQGTFTATRTLNDDKPDVSCGGLGGLSGLRGNQDGVNTAFCDGSAHYITKKVKPEVWKALSTRAGGEVVNPNDF